jgi:hypothetical protein
MIGDGLNYGIPLILALNALFASFSYDKQVHIDSHNPGLIYNDSCIFSPSFGGINEYL